MLSERLTVMDYQVEIFAAVESTMDAARERAENGAVEGLVVHGLEQTGGRGRHGNQWASPRGNLYMSVVLRPNKPFVCFGQMAFVAALALVRAYERAGVEESVLDIKWPNDVLLGGRKGAGILLEAGGDGSFMVLGIGVNIALAPPERARLLDFVEGGIDRSHGGTVAKPEAETDAGGQTDALIIAFRDEVLAALSAVYAQWHEEGFEPIRQAWLKRAAFLGEVITARLPHERVEGVFMGIDPNGALLIKQNSGITRSITSGEVHFGKDHV